MKKKIKLVIKLWVPILFISKKEKKENIISKYFLLGILIAPILIDVPIQSSPEQVAQDARTICALIQQIVENKKKRPSNFDLFSLSNSSTSSSSTNLPTNS